MDIIAEILNAERLAEDKLKSAEEEKKNIISLSEKEEENILAEAKRSAADYRAAKLEETDGEIERQIAIADKSADMRIVRLDKLYEENHLQWEKEILSRILKTAD